MAQRKRVLQIIYQVAPLNKNTKYVNLRGVTLRGVLQINYNCIVKTNSGEQSRCVNNYCHKPQFIKDVTIAVLQRFQYIFNLNLTCKIILK